MTDTGNPNDSMDRGTLDTLTVASSPSMSLSMATTPGSNFLRGNSYGNLANIGNSSVNEQVRSVSRPSGMGGIENVDSIILIYDLDRDETFFRLENHWLPLIERCFNGEVSLFFVLPRLSLLFQNIAFLTFLFIINRSGIKIISYLSLWRATRWISFYLPVLPA